MTNASRMRHSFAKKFATVVLTLCCALLAVPALADAVAAKSASTFTAEVELVELGGAESTTTCTFADLGGRTCAVYPDSKTASAVDSSIRGTVVIPEEVVYGGETYTVVSVAEGAFGARSKSGSVCSGLTGVRLPDTVTVIEPYAFAYCSSLNQVNMPGALTEIGDHAFYYCASLASTITFPDTLETIEGYAFCRCSSLSTLVFEGDGPDVEPYAFTGDGVAIQKVVCKGSGLAERSNRFNSEYVDDPDFYYEVTYYASKDDLSAETNPMGSAILIEGTPLRKLTVDIEKSLSYWDVVYGGSIPEWPEGTNIWLFSAFPDDEQNYDAALAGSCSAYPVFSEYRDLSKAEVSLNASAGLFSYTGMAIDPMIEVSDLAGGTLEHGGDYEVVYQRKDETGSWADTDDVVSPGQVRASVVASEGSRYYGEATVVFGITFGLGAEFIADVPALDEEGDAVFESVWFEVTGFSEDGYTLAVSAGNNDILDEAGGPVYDHAVDIGSYVDLLIPDTIEVCGYEFVITEIEPAAFGKADDVFSAAAHITGVEIPASVTKVGKRAFNGCSNLARVTFAGDADGVTWGDLVFEGASGLNTVVWYGKKADNPYLFVTTDPVDYYTIDFFASQAAAGEGKDPIGSATLREDVVLLDMFEASVDDGALWSGGVPAYPDSYKDDGKWLAPTWHFPDLNADNMLAWQSTLSDSVDAYAAQSNDAYTVDDAFLRGIEDGSTFSYTGEPVVDAENDLRVYSAVGRKLEYEADYTVTYLKQVVTMTEERDEVVTWEETDDVVNGGVRRLVVEGAGGYDGSTYLEFTILAPAASPGTVFSQPIEVTYEDGSVDELLCAFSVNDSETLSVSRSANGLSAISSDRDFSAKIPSHVLYRGVEFEVTAVGASAFSGCQRLTGVTLPDTVSSLGNDAFASSGLRNVRLSENVRDMGCRVFAHCTQLKEAQILASASFASASTYGTSPFASMFLGCTALETAVVGDGFSMVPHSMFSGCTALSSLTLPEQLDKIDASSLLNCESLPAEFPVSATLSKIESGALSGSGITTLVFDEGRTSVPDYFLGSNPDIVALEFPDGLMAIGQGSFLSSKVTEVSVPATVGLMAPSAFGGCSSLRKVVFEGDAHSLAATRAFVGARNIDTVVYRGSAMVSPGGAFSSASPSYYATIEFYENEAAVSGGEPVSTAVMKLGTRLRDINAGTYADGALYEGAVPSLPQGCTVWGFEGSLPLSTTLVDSVAAWGKSVDPNDLANGAIIVDPVFKQTGDAIDPAADGAVSVEDARGLFLSQGADYVVSYQRRDAEGAWVDTTDLSSAGLVRITAAAVSGHEIYTGSVSSAFTIASCLTGETFVDNDENGNPITYLVTSIADDRSAGTAVVGAGGSSSNQAVAPDTAGAVVVPETAVDSQGFSYTVNGISDYAFYRCMYVTSVAVPSTVTEIGSLAFAYERVKTDIATSGLRTVFFGAPDMADVSVAEDAFKGCDVLENVVYAGKKGSFASFGPSESIAFWYTVSYVDAQGEQVARVVESHGSFPNSLSATQKWPGSDEPPDASEDYEWRYESSALAFDGTVVDSMTVREVRKDSATIEACVTFTSESGQSSSIAASFKRIADSDGVYTGEVSLDTGEEGSFAAYLPERGTITVPATIEVDGETLPVAAIGAFAFGSPDSEGACANLVGIEVPASVSSIDQGAFLNCASLEGVTFAGDSALDYIGPSAFGGCASLDAIALPETLETVEARAFAESGLVRVRIPHAVAVVGKSAFAGCASLREVVIGGVMSLSLPAPDGADARWEALAAAGDPQVGGESNASGLFLIDDWVFADCRALERVVFDADMSETALSEVAFEGASGIEDLVYGSGRFAGDVVFGSSDPTSYVTVSYFENAEAHAGFVRQGYVCVAEGTVFEDRAEGAVYAGEEPELPAHYEWVVDFSMSKPLEDSGNAVRRKIPYLIDTTAVDAAFSVVCSVNGEPSSVATYEDVVDIEVSSAYAVQPGGMTVTDVSTGDVLLQTQGASGSFEMPGSAVRVAVEPDISLTVTECDIFGRETVAAVLTLEEALAVSNAREDASFDRGEDRGDLPKLAGLPTLSYGAYNVFKEAQVVTTSSYVPLFDLLDSLGIAFDSGDSVVLFSGDEQVASVTYDVLASERFYFPAFAGGDFEGAEPVAPVLAVASESHAEGEEACSETLEAAYRLLYGQTESDVTRKRSTYANFGAEITGITVLAGAEDIGDFEVGGIELSYAWTGSEICPEPTLTSSGGVLLTEGVDYEVRYVDNVEAGTARVVMSGIGVYKGTVDVSFSIKRAQSLAGVSAVDTAVEIALDSYPNGSNGVVVATSEGFADALSGASLAGLLNYPMLLSEKNGLPDAAAGAIAHLARGSEDFQVIMLGGEAALGPAVSSDIERITGSKPERLGGWDLYETSYLIYLYGLYSVGWSDTAIIASGVSFQDALSASPYAVWSASPLLLSDGKTFTEDFRTALAQDGFNNAVVVGGAAVMSGGLLGEADAALPGGAIRIWGESAYDTSLEMARFAIEAGMSADGAGIATGGSYYDALCGGVALGKHGSVLLLADPSNTTTLQVLGENKNHVNLVRFLGGTAVVPESVREAAIGELEWSGDLLG